MTTISYGYLELQYMVWPYNAVVVGESFNAQTQLKIAKSNAIRSQEQRNIINFLRAVPSQQDRKIFSSASFKVQFDRKINGVSSIRSQTNRALYTNVNVNSQQSGKIISIFSMKTQTQLQITKSNNIKSQILEKIAASAKALSQFSKIISGIASSLNTEFSRGPISHQICGGYLVDPYLISNYLVTNICAHMRAQYSAKLFKDSKIKSQINRKINSTINVHAQTQQQIKSSRNVRSQFNRLASFRVNSQILFALYNTTNLRILHKFPSRGTSGTNWTVVSGGTASGDFSINNVNTDIVEQLYQSTATSCVLQCDTQVTQGIFLDTLGMLNHNLTTSATVLLQGSNDVTFSTIPFTETLSVETINLYYIAPYLPLNSYRYWRLDITDNTNTAGYIRIGTIVFGPTIIFNGECFTDDVVRRKIHFADRVRTEGFSNVSNDRALKYSVGISFRKLNFFKANYSNLNDVVDYVRTSLKALWIPTPRYPSRFAVFGKLTEMPVENHKAIAEDADYIDMDIVIDESI